MKLMSAYDADRATKETLAKRRELHLEKIKALAAAAISGAVESGEFEAVVSCPVDRMPDLCAWLRQEGYEARRAMGTDTIDVSWRLPEICEAPR